jgi:methylase of polypeptide subunit release factors
MKRQLKKNGIAVFEINENLGEKTAAIFQKEYSCEIIKDQFNKDRYIMISPR